MDSGNRGRDQTLTFVRHSDLDLPLTIKLGTLEGLPPPSPSLHSSTRVQHLPSDLYVLLQLWSDGNPLSLPFQSAHKVFKLDKYVWNESITLPIKYRDLPLRAQLTVTVYDIAGPREKRIIGGSTMRLFGKKATLKKGKQRLFVWKHVKADGGVESETPSKVGLRDEMGRLEKLVKKHERGDITRMDWLDKLAFRQIEKVHSVESEKSENLFLYLDMPRFDFPVVFSEPEYLMSTLPSSLASSIYHPIQSIPSNLFGPNDFSSIIDPEIVRDNPVEAKHRRLVRSHRNGPLDRELKPNAKIRDELNEILRYPPTQILTSPQKDLVWQFRFYLTRDKRALTKFLKAVVWTDAGEVKQAVEVLLPMWAQVEMDDTLELLGPGEGYRDRRVRAHAVGLLDKADDQELMLYLLQLVQALKFDLPVPPNMSSSSRRGGTPHASTSTSLALSTRQSLSISHSALPTLEDLLIERSVRNSILGNLFYWYVSVEGEDEKGMGRMYRDLKNRFLLRVAEHQSEFEPDRVEIFARQTTFITKISNLAKELRLSKEPRPKKIERLQSILRDPKSGLGTFAAIPLPLDASRMIVGIDADKSSIFKSNLFPLKLELKCEDGGAYTVIFKNGDDLRQDQLVIQLITLMDQLLRKENLDLKLTPYRVLATGGKDGMVQFVEAKTLADIMGEFGGASGSGGLLGFLRKWNPDPGSVGTFGVDPMVLDTYVRSCAGYCVVTYLLGVGDRHLDNLLLSPTGHFFHVDFGYILGRDPKPFPPAIKVCKEMFDVMGGPNSPAYARFRGLCGTAFVGLRKNFRVVGNLIGLMVEGGIPDIEIEPDKAVSKVQDKFLLHLSEEEAIKEFEKLLNETSYFTSVLDVIHSVAQYYRA